MSRTEPSKALVSLGSLVLCVLLGFAAPPLAAQEPPSAPVDSVGEEISVELVNVEVHATDAQGNPVEALPREAFTLTVDGRPVEISHFAWVAPRRGAGFAGATGDDARAGAGEARTVSVFFDELQVGVRSRRSLVAALALQLAEQLAPADRVAVARFTGAEVEVLLQPTTDRKRLARALEDLSSFSLGQVAAAQEFRTYFEMMRYEVFDGSSGRRNDTCPNMGQLVQGYADAVRRNVEASASALLRYSQQLAREPGRRILLHVSDGIPLVAGGEAYQFAIEMCSGQAATQGVPGARSTSVDDPSGEFQSDRFNPRAGALDATGYQMATLWTEVAARLNALGVTTYAILGAEGDAGFFPESDAAQIPITVRAYAQQNPVDTLALLARETGGLLVRANRGLDAELDRLLDDLGGYYSLAFVPAPAGRPALRRIRVEVAREGVELRYRQSYRLVTHGERIVAQLALAFDADRLDNPLGVKLALRRPGGAAAAERLQVIVPFDRLTLITGADGREEGRFTIFVTLRGANGRVTTTRQRTIEVTRADPKALAYTYELELPAEQVAAAVGVFDAYSGTVAFARERWVAD